MAAENVSMNYKLLALYAQLNRTLGQLEQQESLSFRKLMERIDALAQRNKALFRWQGVTGGLLAGAAGGLSIAAGVRKNPFLEGAAKLSPIAQQLISPWMQGTQSLVSAELTKSQNLLTHATEDKQKLHGISQQFSQKVDEILQKDAQSKQIR
jgi:hypothetical protein